MNCWVYKDSVCSIQVIFDTEVKMRASTILVASYTLFLIMASLCNTGEGFALTLSSRREQLKVAKKRQELAEEDRLRKRLRKLENRETELNRKVTDLKKMLKKYKSTHRTKVSIFLKKNPTRLTFGSSSTIPMHCKTLGFGSAREARNKIERILSLNSKAGELRCLGFAHRITRVNGDERVR